MAEKLKNLNPKREENESYDDYKVRQRENTVWLERRLQGYLFWNSKQRGTYTRKLGKELEDGIQYDKMGSKKSYQK